MTKDQIVSQARRKINAQDDDFWSDEEVLIALKEVEDELSLEAETIENTYTTSSVASQAQYTKPANAHTIKRITYDGYKVKRITERQKDAIGFGTNITITGTPGYYMEFEDYFELYPVPDAVKTLKLWTLDEAGLLSSSSTTLSTPSKYHWAVIIGLSAQLAMKETGHPLAAPLAVRWEEVKKKVRSHVRRSKRGDGPAMVNVEEIQPISEFGTV